MILVPSPLSRPHPTRGWVRDRTEKQGRNENLSQLIGTNNDSDLTELTGFPVSGTTRDKKRDKVRKKYPGQDRDKNLGQNWLPFPEAEPLGHYIATDEDLPEFFRKNCKGDEHD